MSKVEKSNLGLPQFPDGQNACSLLRDAKQIDDEIVRCRQDRTPSKWENTETSKYYREQAVDAYLDAINILDSTDVALQSDDMGGNAKEARDGYLKQARAWATYVTGAAFPYKPTLRDRLAADFEHQLPEVEMRIRAQATDFKACEDNITYLSQLRKEVRDLGDEAEKLAAKNVPDEAEVAVDKYTRAILLIDEAASSTRMELGADLQHTRQKYVSASKMICDDDSVNRTLPPYNRDGCHTNEGRRKRGMGAWCQC